MIKMYLVKLVRYILLSLFIILFSFVNISHAENTPHLSFLVVGSNNLLGKSKSDLTDWTFSRIPYVDEVNFNTASCAGNDLNPSCVIGGFSDTNQPPMLFVSNDGGNHWIWSKIPDLPNKKGLSYEKVACAGEGKEIGCGLIGRKPDPGGGYCKFIAGTGDSGVHWNVLPLELDGCHMLGPGDVSCSGKGEEVLCAVVASESIFVTHDKTRTWIPATVSPLRPGKFNTIHCTDGGANALCIVAGASWTDEPHIAMSRNGGVNWSVKFVAPAEKRGSFNHVYCSERKSQAVCLAVGYTTDDNVLIARSSDAGENWELLSDVPAFGKFNQVICTGSDEKLCIAAGEDTKNHLPTLAISQDAGKTWLIKNIAKSGALNDVQCGENNETKISCLAVGYTGDNQKPSPLLVFSKDGAKNWEIISNANIPKSGSLNAVTIVQSSWGGPNKN